VGVLIDSSVFIAIERAQLELAPYLDREDGAEYFLSVITASELVHGIHRARDAGVRARRSAYVEGILERLPVLPLDLAAARVHAQLSAHLAARGTPIGPHDLWLAAACVADGLSLATHNVREFERVPGLQIEVWAG